MRVYSYMTYVVLPGSTWIVLLALDCPQRSLFRQVYECMIRGIAVMRRRADSYVNATQILKVAGIDKGRRTKILEKEILPGKHEIVQGGYGKYQGTWCASVVIIIELSFSDIFQDPPRTWSRCRQPIRDRRSSCAVV